MDVDKLKATQETAERLLDNSMKAVKQATELLHWLRMAELYPEIIGSKEGVRIIKEGQRFVLIHGKTSRTLTRKQTLYIMHGEKGDGRSRRSGDGV